jgi:uncharacterized SAM-dependent methyltransferase
MFDIPFQTDESVSPECVTAGMKASLSAREINPKFHYLGAQQAQNWLRVHRQYSPFAKDPKIKRIYEAAFEWTARRMDGARLHLVSIACGEARKEMQLLKALESRDLATVVTLTDFSSSLVGEGCRLLAKEQCAAAVEAVVLDFMEAKNLAAVLFKPPAETRQRLVTCFGLMPNVDPRLLVKRLHLLGETALDAIFLIGTNLAGSGDIAGTLQEYDNEETRNWLFQILLNTGFKPADGDLSFSIEPCRTFPQLPQVVARFNLKRKRTIFLGGEQFDFHPAETVRVFFSNRFQKHSFRQAFEQDGFQLLEQWTSDDHSEGIIACRVTCP